MGLISLAGEQFFLLKHSCSPIIGYCRGKAVYKRSLFISPSIIDNNVGNKNEYRTYLEHNEIAKRV